MDKDFKLVAKLFDGKKVRTVWNKEEEKFYVSVIDMIKVLVDSVEPRKYWNWLKNKLLKDEELEASSITRQLKLMAKDGKMRMTDVVDIEGMFRLIESIPSKKAEPVN